MIFIFLEICALGVYARALTCSKRFTAEFKQYTMINRFHIEVIVRLITDNNLQNYNKNQ